MRWSRLKNLIEELFDPNLDLQIFCTVQRGERGSIGRYWFVLDGRTIWDKPKQVSASLAENRPDDSASEMTSLLRAYLETPKDDIAAKEFAGDKWGITQLLMAADRRVGRRRFAALREKITDPAALLILEKREKS